MRTLRGMLLITLAVFFLSGAAVHAEEQYRTELSAFFQRTDPDGGGGGRVLWRGLAAEYFLSAVPLKDHPYAEAAFLEHIGGTGFVVEDADFKRDPGATGDARYYDLFANYTTPDFPLVLQAEWTRFNNTYKYQLSSVTATSDSTSDTYTMTIGKYLSQGLLIRAFYRYGASENKSQFISSFPLLFSEEESTVRTTEYAADVKYVKELGNGSAFNLAAMLARDTTRQTAGRNNTTIVVVDGDYYFTRSFSIGAFVESENGPEFTDGKFYEAHSTFFFTPSLSLTAEYLRFLNDHDGIPGDRSYAFTVAVRF